MVSTTTDRRFGVNAGKAIKVPCKAATTANITLYGEQTIDGVLCVTDDRVLVKSQTDATENGIYYVDTGEWARSPDFDDINDSIQGTMIHVLNGTTNEDTMFKVDTSGTITPGTTSISFSVVFSPYFSNYVGIVVESKTEALSYITTYGITANQYMVVTSSDGGDFVAVTGAAPGTYADDGGSYCGTQFIPTGGDGSAAMVRKYSGAVRAEWFGSDEAAVIAAAGITDTVIIGTNITAALTGTFPSNALYIFEGDGQLTVTTGITITIRGVVEAPIKKIFYTSGTGSVVGIRKVYPEWFGAVGDQTTNDIAALNDAHTCIQGSKDSKGDRPTIKLTAKGYGLNSTWSLEPTADCGLLIEGNGTIFSGTRLRSLSGFSTGPLVHVKGQTDATQKVADWKIENVPMLNSAGTPTIGLAIGESDSSKNLIGLQQNAVENVYISNFTEGLKIANARLIRFSRVSIWNDSLAAANTCLKVVAIGSFTGDMSFTECQFVSTVGTSRYGIHIDSSNGAYSSGVNHIAGIDFDKCDIYSAHTKARITASNSARVSDIFFNSGCQFDDSSNHDVYVESSGASTLIRNIQINDSFLLGGNTSSSDHQISFLTASSGQIVDVFVNDNYIGNAIGAAVDANGIQGIQVNNNEFVDLNYQLGYGINIENTTRAQVNNNTMTRISSNYTKYMVRTAGTSDYYVIVGNVGGGIVSTAVITDGASGVNKYLAGNI